MDYKSLYNKYRPMTGTPPKAAELLRGIEAASRLKCGGIVNCSNLSYETTVSAFEESVEYCSKLSDMSGLPVICNALREDLCEQARGIEKLFPVKIYVTPIWER